MNYAHRLVRPWLWPAKNQAVAGHDSVTAAGQLTTSVGLLDGEVRETSTSVGELTVSPAVLSDEAYLVVTAVGALTATAGDLVGAERTSIGSTGALTGSAGDLAGAERTTVGATGNLTVTGGGLSGGVATAVASGPAVWIEYDDTYVSTPTRDLGTGPFTDLSASFWMKTDDYAGISLGMINGHGTNGSTIFLYISSGYLGYQEGDDGGQHENDWRAELATDGERHHYGMKAGQFYIDGVPVTMTNSSGGHEIGDHPSVTGTAQILYSFAIPSGSHVELADVRLFTMSSDVQAQAGYNSTLLDDGSTTIVGAWLMADGSGNPADRSVKNSPLTLETGMTWEP